ncbi:tetratricopeptide repeat protein [Actinomycetospora sp. OC33-EN08]|uniref:Tetratricopeptide repeat protein n=1 Tax=Actinomycetospora aurantiaca TaxID=3129233 RepID=A0ABU8MGC6_9PSEU
MTQDRSVRVLGDNTEPAKGAWLGLAIRAVLPEPDDAPELPVGEAPPPLAAFLDSGLMSRHPSIKPYLNHEDSVDLTDEGTLEDLAGHGTVVALIFLSAFSAAERVRYEGNVVNIKIAGSDGRGSKASMIAGLEHLERLQEKYPERRIVANISAGVYGTTFLGQPCRGRCRVCRTALRVADAGVLIVAAAGNAAGRTTCPAVAGLDKKDVGIFAVTAPDLPFAGVGDFGSPGRLDAHPWLVAPESAGDVGDERAMDPDDVAWCRSALDGLRAAPADDGDLAHLAGVLHERLGETDAALADYVRGARCGHPRAAVAAGRLERARGNDDAERALYDLVPAAGLAVAQNNLGVALRDRGRTGEALRAFELADEYGEPEGTYNLGCLLAATGQTVEAEKVHARAAAAGDGRAANNLGALLEGRGDHEGARAAYQRSIDLGVVEGHTNLGRMLLTVDPTSERAVQLLSQAADKGATSALLVLAGALLEQGDAGQARNVLLRAESLGDAGASFHLGILLREQGDLAGAAEAWERGAAAGHAGSAHDLGLVHYHAGRFAEAKAAWELSAALGDHRAVGNLEVLARQVRNLS